MTYTYRMRFPGIPVSPGFVMDKRIVMLLVEKFSTSVSVAEVEERESSMIYSTESYTPPDSVLFIQIGWLVDSGFVPCVYGKD